jgi:hypothetical protein
VKQTIIEQGIQKGYWEELGNQSWKPWPCGRAKF